MAEFRKPEIKHNRRWMYSSVHHFGISLVRASRESVQCHRNHLTSFIPTLFHSDFNVPTWALRRHKLGLLLWPDKCGICPPASARASYPHHSYTVLHYLFLTRRSTDSGSGPEPQTTFKNIHSYRYQIFFINLAKSVKRTNNTFQMKMSLKNCNSKKISKLLKH